jgi:hypothetical protein
MLKALTLCAAVFALTASAAQAGDSKSRYKNARYYAKPCDHTCVRARHLDPAGNYKAYPDWARAALSPKTDGARR